MSRQEAEKFADALYSEYDCVIAAGYQASEPPGRQAIIEGLLQGGRPTWSAVSEVLSHADQDAFVKVRDAVVPRLAARTELTK